MDIDADRLAAVTNGKQVVYVLQEADLDQNRRRSNLFLADVETGRSFKLTNGPGKNDSPCWSPDGEWVAFLSDRSDPMRKPGSRNRAQIWLIRPDGGEAKCLTRSKSAVSGFKWSPVGDRIVFTAVDVLSKDEEKKKKDKDDARMIGRDVRMAHLWAIDVKERKAQRLTRGRFHITGFDWSPNGRQLVYAYARTPISDEARPVNLAVIPSGGGRRKVLVQRSGADRSPRWSPDGKTIAFVSEGGVKDRQAQSRLWIVPARGGESRCLLPAEDRFGSMSAWSR
jgi:Tol biopolymer transport system component